MDLGFKRLDTTRAEAAPVPLDYLQLIAALSTMQAASRTAALEARLRTGTFTGAQTALALVELLAAGHGWVGAAATLGGSFHPDVAAKLRGAPS